MALALTKALLYLGAILLVGAGVYARFVAPAEPGGRPRRVVAGVTVGALTLLAAGLADVVLTLRTTLGFVESGLVLDYLAGTRHGTAVLARGALLLATAATVLVDPAGAVLRRGIDAAFVVSAALLLATFSWTSHAAAMAGTPPLLADLAHFAAAAAWAGPLVYLALSPAWNATGGAARAALTTALTRVSRLGLIGVGVLALTGVYASLIHLQDPERFVRSSYGVALYVKLALVATIVAIAAVHRFRLLPAFVRGASGRRFRDLLRVEAALLVAVFVATGVLTTRAVPHGTDATVSALDNLMRLIAFLTR